MAELPKTPTQAASRVCGTCNENIVVENHPLDLFGAKASQENIPVLERFFELKVVFDDGLPSYICRCCHHKVMKFQEFFRKIAFSRQQQESVLRVKRGKTTAESPLRRSPQTTRDLKKRRIYKDLQKGPPSDFFGKWTNLRKLNHRQYFLDLQQVTGKKRKLAKRIESSAEPSAPPKQEEILLQSSLLNPSVL